MSLAAGSPFGKKVVTYKVRVVVRDPAAFPEYKARDTAVWRRFRDFVALADLLAESHKGYFVPPRPEKKPLSLTADDAFVRTARTSWARTWTSSRATPRAATPRSCASSSPRRTSSATPSGSHLRIARGASCRQAPGPGSGSRDAHAGSSADADTSSSMRATAEGGAPARPPVPGPGPREPESRGCAVPPKRGVGKFFNRLGAAGAALVCKTR